MELTCCSITGLALDGTPMTAVVPDEQPASRNPMAVALAISIETLAFDRSMNPPNKPLSTGLPVESTPSSYAPNAAGPSAR